MKASLSPARRTFRRACPVVGDAGAYLLATLVGFAAHRELGLPALERILATWLPFTLAGLLVAAVLGLYRQAAVAGRFSPWRVALAALLAAPLGAWARSVWLHTAIVPVFVLVMATVTGTALLLWRGLYARAARRSAR